MNTSQTKHYWRYFTYIEPVLKAPIIRTYGSLILTIIALIVFIVFAIKPTLATISNLQKELEVKKETLEKLTKKSDDLTQARDNLQKIPTGVKDKLQTNIPAKVEISSFIKTLEATTIKSQATISALQFQPLLIEPEVKSTKDPILTEIFFIYNVEGSYEIINQVLQNLRANPRLIVMDNFTINKIPDGSTLLLSVTGRAFYVK